MDGRRYHDMGGRDAGRCDLSEHAYDDWEMRVDALFLALTRRKRAMTVDELRRSIEDLGASAYDAMGYYERWMHSITQALVQRGVITLADLGRKLAEIEARESGSTGNG